MGDRRRSLVCLSVVACLAGCDRGAVSRGPSSARAVVASAPALMTSPAPPAPAVMTSAEIDARLGAAWRSAGVAPTAPADDATWYRRLWVDVAGTIPPPEEARAFAIDTRPDKRARAIESLLASPRWADHWSAYWDEVWMGRDVRAPEVDQGAFRGWLHDVLAREEPWNRVVAALLTASGRNSDGRPRREAAMDEGRAGQAPGVNGAVNWSLKYVDAPQDLAGAASRTILGVQIQCAQCHDHKTEKWTQEDFRRFAAAFMRTRPQPANPGPPMGAVRVIDLVDLGRPAPRFARGSKGDDLGDIARERPTALDGTDLGDGLTVRAALAHWVTAPENPWFARATVNRIWGHFFGRGFVNPVDDLRPSNPPVAPDLLDALAADFVASGYDMKHLVRVIAGTAAYGVSAAPLDAATAKADPEAKLWERFRVSPLGPDELLDAVVAATGLNDALEIKGGLDLAEIRGRLRARYGFLFDIDEESDPPDYEGTVGQALALLDGSVIATGATRMPGTALADVLSRPGDDASKIDAIYQRVLSRPADAEEIDRWTRYIAAARDLPAPPASDARGAKREKPAQPDPLRRLEQRYAGRRTGARERAYEDAYEDLVWTLLNSSEFVLNH